MLNRRVKAKAIGKVAKQKNECSICGHHISKADIKRSAETLQEMVEKKCFPQSRAGSCMNLYNHATAKMSYYLL